MKEWSPRDIEDKKGQNDLGVMLYRIYEGVISEETATWLEGYIIVAAFVHGMFKASNEGEEEDVS